VTRKARWQRKRDLCQEGSQAPRGQGITEGKAEGTKGQASEAERGRYKPTDLFLRVRYFNESKCSLFLNWNSPFHAEPKQN